MKKWLCALALVALVAACGGGDDDDSAGGDSADDATSSTVADDDGGDEDDESTTTTADDASLPQFISDFDRVCTTQVGFSGAADYDAAPGAVHPVILFEDDGDGTYVETSWTSPEGWAIEQDSDFEDNSELAETQLIACSARVDERPTGTMCDFENDDETVTLELVDSTYELKVYAATTGDGVLEATLEGTSGGECPFIATFQEGDTTFVAEPEEDAVISALQPAVAP